VVRTGKEIAMKHTLFTRILSFVLSVAMVCTCAPLSVFAQAIEETQPGVIDNPVETTAPNVTIVESGTLDNGLTWTLDSEGTLSFSGEGALPDVSFGPGGGVPWSLLTVKKLVIKSGITSIGQSGFANHTALTSVTLPDSVTAIGNNAFSQCSNLQTVTLGNGVVTIGEGAFGYCGNLKSITLPSGLTTIGSGAFTQCTGLTEITIPGSVTSVGTNAFTFCQGLTDVTISEGLSTIGNGMFINCIALERITIPASVTYISEHAFAYCTALTDVYYAGDEATWNTITIAPDNAPLSSATIHFGSAGSETVPSTEATTPSTEATVPSTEATVPSTEATTAPTEPTTEPVTEPTVETTVPADVEIPEEGGNHPEGDGDVEEDIYKTAVDVSSASELEDALVAGETVIRIAEDMVIDRTFYITESTVLFTQEAHTLTRDPGFAGDIFVVGESAEGVRCENPVTLTVGDPQSTTQNLLVIDGNRDNLTAAVTGSVFFIVGGANVTLYENVTVSNHYKSGNEKTLTENYGVSYPGRTGGAVAIISADASMNIFGGIYENNSANDFGEDTSTEEGMVCTYGGAIYNYGKLNIYGGLFQNNHAGRGGAIYCYRTTKIYNAQFLNNTSSAYGGAIYMPSSTSAFLYLGGENSFADSQVIFQGNTATENGGAIYARNYMEAQDVQFIENQASSGGAIAAGAMELILYSSTFDSNTVAKYGAAIYYTDSNSKENTYDLTCIDTAFENSSASASGGAIYMNGGASAYMENAAFTKNTASNHGGAIYLNNASVDVNGGSFTENGCGTNGGAVACTNESSLRLNDVTASKNTGKQGGFVYLTGTSSLHMYDSLMQENTATGNGGAVHMIEGAYGGVYNTTFHKNTSGSSGGALYIYTSGYDLGSKVELYSCTYSNNEAVYGGAIYTAKQSVIDLYNSTAKYNHAGKGGFMYHTAYDTTVNLAALVLQGNTATDGGPIIWGNTKNAVLNLDKALYVDQDVEGVLDDTYWANAIYNLLTVKEKVIEIPNYIGYDGTEVIPDLPRIPVSINSSEELENALTEGKDLLRIDADFQLDRTFYIYRKTTIYSTAAHTLTRAPGFAGDIFVVGEQSDGTICENEVVLTLGDPESTEKNMLTIDGNKDNLTVTVTGSVLFVVEGACADLYENVTIQNHKKLGNEKTLTEKYGVSYVNQVGGAVAIVAASASMNIYGGTYKDNAVHDVNGEDSSQGGAFYNFGKMYIYGGTFEGNYAARGGAFYCYRPINIYKAEIKNNSASTLGGAVYMPNSTAAVLNVGLPNDLVESSVTFSGNTAVSYGGAIYACNKINLENTTFTNNSGSAGGAIFNNNAVMTMCNCNFTENSSTGHGGAVYVNAHNTQEKETDLTVTDCTFTSNTATKNGGAIYITGTGVVLAQSSTFTTNAAAAGGAIYSTNGTLTVETGTFTQNGALTGAGGAIALYTNSTGVLNKINVTKNHTDNSVGGGIFVKNSSLTMYRSTLQENSSASNGGGLHMDAGASGSIYATDFIKNTAASSGGGLFLYTNTGEVLVHSCNFTENSGGSGGAIYASNKAIAKMYNITATDNASTKGGFLYETTTGTEITLVGVTVSGNTATDGGPVIWGNSTGAVLHLDKSQWTDLDHTGTYDSAYWKAAIVNKLTVKDLSEEVPGWLDYQEESYEHMADAVDVSTAQELEDAINAGAKYIRVIADMEIDRTFYISGNTTIFSTLPRTLTRAADFGGDIFVVGETADGKSALLLGSNAKLVLGNPLSAKENLLVIDGNKDNMTTAVVGSALFICNSSIVDLHTNVTFRNTHKSDNVRTYEERYAVALPNRIGGPLAVVASGTMNIYGGNYRDNTVNEELGSEETQRTSTLGGLIFNYGNVHIFGGTFANNQAARGGVIYNYKILKIYGGSFIGNIATQAGGVIYAPNTVPSHTHIGSADENGAQVLFQGNQSKNGGGAIYSSALCTLVIHGNTTFKENTSLTNSGGAITCYGQLTARNTVFESNVAAKNAGAVYLSKSNNEYLTRIIELTNCTFKYNQAANGGAFAMYAGGADYDLGTIANVSDCTFTENTALSPVSATAKGFGGAVYVERKSVLTVTDSVFKNNSAKTEGGAIYAGGSSTLSITGSKFNYNAISPKGTHGGAISIHSVTLDLTDTTFTGNTAIAQAGALYISYSSALDRNSEVTINGGSFTGNTTEGFGGAIYATKQTVTEEKRVLTVNGTTFSKNVASEGGAITFSGKSTAYMTDCTFSKNETTEGLGGAIYNSSGTVELDTATFTGNSAVSSGGAVAQTGGSMVLYNITAKNNASGHAGGFFYGDSSALTVYDSLLEGNTSVSNGGAVALYGGCAANVYATDFVSNASEASGGGLFLYTDTAECLIHTCNFTDNSGTNGGAIYASNKSVASLYNITATNNTSTKGGFLYETTTGTTLTLVGATVSGNTATSGGPIIWGNSTGAVLNLDKDKFADSDYIGIKDDSYWAATIYNKLTVNEISMDIPAYEPYQSKRPGEVTPPAAKDPVSVQDVFNVSQSTSNTVIGGAYAKFPKLDNTSNFMSKGVTTFENINGGTVTVDSFIYPTRGTADNCSVGEGLLIFQAMCYKQAHPEEEVYIDISAYRFSVQAAVNIARNSRYFGYMRQLSGNQNYDTFGFVRIAYLLISAAKMGIHVNVIGHLDAYPVSENTLQLYDYFTTQLNDPCDPAYVENGVISDYMNFCKVEWDLDRKGGNDMMHTKMCAVSHYLDMNGVAHRNAVWSSSSNLDGINGSGTNANWKLQTATIVSGHEAIYQTAVNYLRLIPQYSNQEGVYEFQNLINRKSTQQAQMILSGQEDQIPAGEQIIYLGRDTDQVFELYFTPMGGDILSWDEVQNPYCKYLRKLYNSEDYIIFTWNAAEYSGKFALGRQIENMIIAAFHENRNVNNKIYGNMESFDTTTFDDLEVGVDIGFKSLNQWELGEVHNKDLTFSYVENGQRYYVSLLNSMNMHSGSMYYQSNFALVIKETELTEDSVFFTMMEHTTTGIVEHAWTDEVLEYLPETNDDGYTYHPCANCDERMVLDVVHRVSDWTVVQEATAQQNGIAHRTCTACGLLLDAREFEFAGDEVLLDLSQTIGKTFTRVPESQSYLDVPVTPLTIEATLQLDSTVIDRGGVVVGNYDNTDKDQLNLEIFTYGRPRLFLSTGGERTSHIFNTDIRSMDPVHLAITIEGRTAKLYLNGQLEETAELSLDLPVISDYLLVGGDERNGNSQYFKGTIYNVSLFSDVRTETELAQDAICVFPDEADLMVSKFYNRTSVEAESVSPAGRTFAADSQVRTGTLSSTPLTLEATVQIPKTMWTRAGTILGNYNGSKGQHINLEAYEGGKIRLYLRNGTTAYTYLFPTDIRSEKPVHIAVTIDGLTATLYVDGEATATQTLTVAAPNSTDSMRIGGDNRPDNAQYFKGTLYAVSLFDHVRTPEQIRSDMFIVSNSTEGLLYARRFAQNDSTGTQLVGGKLFSETTSYDMGNISATPKTLEATIQLSNYTLRAGVIAGNYANHTYGLMNLEIYTRGRVRLYYTTDEGVVENCIFDPSILSPKPTHIAVTIDGLTATLYINGKAAQTKTLSVEPGTTTQNWKIGGDNRTGNIQYFKGTICNVNLFSDVRTPEEILADATGVSQDADALLYSHAFSTTVEVEPFDILSAGKTYTVDTKHPTVKELPATPLTMEAVIQLDPSVNGRGGVVMGNYDGLFHEMINLEVFYNGKPRLFYSATDGTRGRLNFDTDIRSKEPVHIAVTIDGLTASLYVNGTLAEQKIMPFELPVITKNFKIGHDNRQGNAYYFKGKIYSASMFSDVRPAQQILQDLIHIDVADPALLYTGIFVSDICAQEGHIAGDVIQDIPVSETTNGIRHTECTVCGQLLQLWKTPRITNIIAYRDYETAQGINPSTDAAGMQVDALTTGPVTFEATVLLSKTVSQRAGVIMGNYDGSNAEQINLEVYTSGRPRLYFKTGGTAYSYTFKKDIRSDKPVHLALTVDGLTATLYVDGVLTETITLGAALPVCTENFWVGCDNRSGTPQYFAGTIYSAAMYSGVRTQEQILVDRYLPCTTNEGLLLNLFFPGEE